MNLYVIRHGQTDSNKEHKYNCRYDEELNKTGREQAEEARSNIKELQLDLIISSPMKRTRQTTEIININNVPVIFDERLIERDGGKLTQTSIDDFYFEEYYNFYSTKYIEGLETLPQLFDRIHSFLDDIKEKYENKNILLVTHGAVARAIQFYFEKMPTDGMLLKISGQKNCELKKYIL